jgi:hypothetical protein
METLDKHFRDLTRAAFARYGLASADLAAGWAEIAGAELAAISAPERIRWPKGSSETARQTGGTLTVRAAPGRALDVEYAGPLIIERVNRFLGYGAVARVKVIQAGRWERPRPAAQPVVAASAPFAAEIEAVEDTALRAALTRLGRGVASRRAGSPQDE